MDLNRALRDLYEEKKYLDRAIARLEARLVSLNANRDRSTRGRKEMGPEERVKVSERMTAYWAARRARAGGDSEQDGTEAADSDPQLGSTHL